MKKSKHTVELSTGSELKFNAESPKEAYILALASQIEDGTDIAIVSVENEKGAIWYPTENAMLRLVS